MNTSLNFSNGKENKITKRYYCDNSSEIIPEDYESTDQIYAINDNKLYEIEVSNEKTASGAIASFSDGADNVPVEALSVSLEPVQDLHGQTSPYPAGGGVNKWDEEWELGYYNVNTGVATASNTQIRCKNPISVTPSATYYVASPKSMWVLEYDENDTYLNIYSSKANASITVSANTHYIRFYGINGYGTVYNHDIAINYPSTVTTYSPYENICPITGHTQCEVWREATYDTTAEPQITIPLGQTVYGGALDVVGGVLTVDRAMDTLSGLVCEKGVNNYQTFAVRPTNVMAVGENVSLVQSSVWNGLPQSRISSLGDNYVWGSSANGTFRIKSTAYADMTAAEFKEAFADAQFCYLLATPITIDLSDIPTISTLLGQNNIWSDSGDVSVEYRADIQKYIAKVIAEALA